ncbi:[SSU ribosomal protein S18P]-alanine acetyltransferase [Desulfitobacterium sp. LBE]|uniref:[Ribosomal protein bS18]-alanine N-acetyltransferase n=5 Tax=root TaxID=1 RepID=Q24QC8_DESHY|nr:MULTISPECIES: ribosomal protein S18-alanine N-acetyltransferase [Desulfitobacterium]ACL19448.1 ribosomal-protein-alanine acetyltransferase [Desulfitobacterium hafniense DCB-2]EHL04039.1 ribosomal-protein-alanine acetyltransferase [Desulfitobacterium hafniense DP7]KTE89264.1 ribosomal-protein-alanine acetyltransferase [Desulfitobacterium hafniense]MEA5023598.1 ribosomal protein S18-alanine N-acetyltransferase [Desulfitobacterium hafniense]TWH57692.1 [SSU ribosomal protein S18P]-alanine acety
MMIRPMQESDLSTILEIEHACFPAPWAPQSFVSELRDNEYARYFCLEHEGNIIGYMGLWFILEEGHITNVAVAPGYQGMGGGEFLMRSVIDLMVKEGMERMTLEVRASNTSAQRLYERLGFVTAGVRKGYYSDNREDALIMWLDIGKD